jgi:nucleoside-diphosphate-sugar epimerase
VVFHAAAWVSEGGNKADVWAVNVAGAQNAVDAAVAAGVARFVHLSSCSVYGSLQQLDIDETSPTRMRGNLYGDSKVAAEEVLFAAYRERGLPVVAARASQVYGPRSPQFTIRPVEVIKAGKMVLIDGGRHLCKPVYIDNLVDGLILCAKVEAAVGEAINLTDDEPVPWRDFFGAYGRMLNIDSFPSAPYAVAWLIGLYNEIKAGLQGKKASLNRGAVNALRSDNSFSNQKARTLLGWAPKVDLTEGMKETEAWLRAAGYLNREG